MTQQDARSLKIGQRVKVKAKHVNGGVPECGHITAIDNPGREFGVRLRGGRYCTLFNDELERKQ